MLKVADTPGHTVVAHRVTCSRCHHHFLDARRRRRRRARVVDRHAAKPRRPAARLGRRRRPLR